MFKLRPPSNNSLLLSPAQQESLPPEPSGSKTGIRHLEACLLLAMVAWSLLLAPARAYTTRVGLFLARRPGDPYIVFLQQAEAAASLRIQSAFAEDLLISEVVMTVAGENQGISMPLMEIRVTRNQWLQQPEAATHANYYRPSSTLLGL
jgi:hypothetical protein